MRRIVAQMKKNEEWLSEEKYGGKKPPEYFDDLKRLDAGEPLAFVIGWVPFLATKIFLDSRPLIPRPETEFWVEKAIEYISSTYGGRASVRVLDLCAGSGCIGVAVLKALPSATVDFAEITERHHETIRKNVTENAIDVSRARIFGGDLFEYAEGPYDVILANPPYIPEGSTRVEKSVIEFEPYGALFAGEDGLAVITRIVREARSHLAENGCVCIEHEPEQAAFIHTEAEQLGFEAYTENDQFSVQRYTFLIRKSA